MRLVHLKAFVDYVNPKEDEFIYATVSFLRQRFQTLAIQASTEVIFSEEEASMLFEFQSADGGDLGRLDPSMLLKLNHQVHVTILK